jgi:hypothetical protein
MPPIPDPLTDDDPRITVLTESPLAVWRGIAVGLALVGISALAVWGALALVGR